MLSVGESVTCYAYGNPVPSVTWRRMSDGQVIRQNSTLTINEMSNHTYVCHAINIVRGVRFHETSREIRSGLRTIKMKIEFLHLCLV